MISTRKLVTAGLAGLLLTITACSSQGGAQNQPGGAGGPALRQAVSSTRSP
jgi:hypothetical protein